MKFFWGTAVSWVGAVVCAAAAIWSENDQLVSNLGDTAALLFVVGFACGFVALMLESA